MLTKAILKSTFSKKAYVSESSSLFTLKGFLAESLAQGKAFWPKTSIV